MSQGDNGPSKTAPDDSYISHPSLRHLNHRHLLLPPQTAGLYYDDTIESLFSGLSVSQHNNGNGQGFNGGCDAFVGRSVLDRSLVGGTHQFLVQDMGQNLYDVNGANSFASTTTISNIWDNFISDSAVSPNVNGFILGDDSRGGFSNSSVSKITRDLFSPGFGLYNNRRPYWLQREPSYNNYSSTNQNNISTFYSSSPLSLRGGGGGGGSNLECIVPLPLEYLMGKIIRLAKDQNGCRLLQKTLENLTHNEIDMILLEVTDYIGELMPHPFGNYVVQKLVEVCTEEQLTRILLAVTKTELQLVRICLNIHGSRAVQKLLEGIASRQQVSISARQQVSIVMSALNPGAVDLAKDMNGQHVIKYCLSHFLLADNKYLLKVVADNCYDIATDKSGCCVLQQCVEHSSGEPRDLLVAKITEIALLLAQDKYGNYVVQHLLGLKIPRIIASLVGQLEGYFTALSCDKYGSNVVEKCLVESRTELCAQIVSELLRSSSFPMLLVDPFGNFVIQSALRVSKGPVLRALLEMICPNIPAMRSNIYGKKVLSWLHKERLLASRDVHC